ncbi:YgaP family membrane protein [Candidatus Methylocalor cossyra]|uniref:Inner membrane protein YgaP-like transmembrane domain-containing protein n=1 Tax=Candidatus Methylocalor cossyra TaxID=3108543 RepID=A0ABP1C5S1_9GAMM
MRIDFKRLIKPEVNIGFKDQRIRYGLGSALLLVSVFLANIPLLLLGGILVATAKSRWCPVYSSLGHSTYRPGEEPAAPDCCAGHQ